MFPHLFFSNLFPYMFIFVLHFNVIYLFIYFKFNLSIFYFDIICPPSSPSGNKLNMNT